MVCKNNIISNTYTSKTKQQIRIYSPVNRIDETDEVIFTVDGSNITAINSDDGSYIDYTYNTAGRKTIQVTSPILPENNTITLVVKVEVEIDAINLNTIDDTPVFNNITLKGNITNNGILVGDDVPVIIQLNGRYYNSTVKNGIINETIDTSNLKSGMYIIAVIANPDTSNVKVETTILNMIKREIDRIDLRVDNVNKQPIIITTTTYNENNNTINSGRVIFKVDGSVVGSVNVDENGVAVLNYTDILWAGNYDISVEYTSDYYNMKTNKTKIATRNVIDTPTIETKTVTYSTSSTIKVNLTSNGAKVAGSIDCDAKIIINGVERQLNTTFRSGKLTIKIPNDIPATGNESDGYDIIVNIKENDMYDAKEFMAKVYIQKSNAILLLDVANKNITTLDTLKATVQIISPSELDGKIAFTILNKSDVITTIYADIIDTQSTLNYDLNGTIPAGEYTLKAAITSPNFEAAQDMTKINITPVDVADHEIIIGEIKTLENIKINEILLDVNGDELKGTSNIEVLIGNKSVLNVTITGGNLTIEIPTNTLKAATYNTTIVLKNVAYNMKVFMTQFNITRRDVDITIAHNNPKVLGVLQINTTIYSAMKSVECGVVTFKINGCTLKDTNGNTIKVAVNSGVAQLNYTLPESIGQGLYNITALYSDKNYYNSNIKTVNNTQITRVDMEDIIVEPVEIRKGENTIIDITLRDTNGNTIVKDVKVVIKLNNKTFIQTKTTDGILNLELNTSTQKAKQHTIDVIFDKNSLYNQQRCTINLTIKNRIADIKINTLNTKTTQTLPIVVIVQEDGQSVNGGFVTFKLNGKTLKDTQGNVIYAEVVDSKAILSYKLPTTLGSGNYTLCAQFRNSDFESTEAETSLEITKSIINNETLDCMVVKYGSDLTINSDIFDMVGSKIKATTKVTVKLDDKTFITTAIVNGKLRLKVNTTNMKVGNHTIIVKLGENSLYSSARIEIPIIVEN